MIFEFDGKDLKITSEFEHDASLTVEEDSFVKAVLNMLKDYTDINQLFLIKKSNDYTTLAVKSKVLERGHDLIRFKLTPRTMWAAVWITPETREQYFDSELFSSQKNKNQLHWKSKLNSPEDVSKLKDVLLSALEDIKRVEKL